MTARTERVGRPADVLRQHYESAHGGEGWVPRQGTMADDLGRLWAECGVPSECGTLRAVLMRSPGPEINDVPDYRAALWLGEMDPKRAREQHAAFVAFYESHGVAVHLMADAPRDKPNAYFCRDHFCMTSTGAVIARMASHSRAGEERYSAAALAGIGVPIVHSVHGDGLFEGADVVVVNEDLVFVGHGMRTNRSGAEQVADAFRRVGVPRVEIVQIPYGCGHIDGTVNIVDRDLAMVYPTQLSWVVYETLREHGFRFIDLPDASEAQTGMAINVVPLEPGVIVAPEGNPITKRLLERADVEVLEVEVDELMKGGGSVHCMTGVIWRT
jgi:N-dimethylarginine dimethylaminohydrolase